MTDICAECGDLLTDFEIDKYGDICHGCKSEQELIVTNKYHVCNVLKDFTRDLYFYKENDFTENLYYWLDYILCSNQHITNTFTYLMRYDMGDKGFYEKYPKGLFPTFLREYDIEIILENEERINKEIESIKASKPGKINYKKKVSKLIETIDKVKLLDLTIPYSNLISILKYEDDPELERAEYGYYIGSLINIKVQEYLKKININFWPEPDRDVLKTRVLTFRSTVFETMSKENLSKCLKR